MGTPVVLLLSRFLWSTWLSVVQETARLCAAELVSGTPVGKKDDSGYLLRLDRDVFRKDISFLYNLWSLPG